MKPFAGSYNNQPRLHDDFRINGVAVANGRMRYIEDRG